MEKWQRCFIDLTSKGHNNVENLNIIDRPTARNTSGAKAQHFRPSSNSGVRTVNMYMKLKFN